MDVNFSQNVSNPGAPLPERNEERKLLSEVQTTDKTVTGTEDSAKAQNAKDQQKRADTDSDDGGIEEAIEEIRDFANVQNRQLDFSVDEDSQRRVIKVLDSETGDVIRQIPSEEVLKLAERIKELQTEVGAAVGVFFNKAV